MLRFALALAAFAAVARAELEDGRQNQTEQELAERKAETLKELNDTALQFKARYGDAVPYPEDLRMPAEFSEMVLPMQMNQDPLAPMSTDVPASQAEQADEKPPPRTCKDTEDDVAENVLNGHTCTTLGAVAACSHPDRGATVGQWCPKTCATELCNKCKVDEDDAGDDDDSAEAFIANGAGGAWKAIGGLLKHVATSDTGVVWGVNSNDDIYYSPDKTGKWEHVAGKLKQITVSGNGQHIWGVTSGDGIFYRKGRNGGWEHVGGALKFIDVSGDGSHIWGVNSNDDIYYRNGRHGNWQHITGACKVAAAHYDSMGRPSLCMGCPPIGDCKLKQISVSSGGAHIWGVNSDDEVFYRNGRHGVWVPKVGKLKHVSVNDDGTHVWGVNSQDDIFYRNGKSGAWKHIGGKLKQVAVAGDGREVAGVDSADNVFFRDGLGLSGTSTGGRPPVYVGHFAMSGVDIGLLTALTDAIKSMRAIQGYFDADNYDLRRHYCREVGESAAGRGLRNMAKSLNTMIEVSVGTSFTVLFNEFSAHSISFIFGENKEFACADNEAHGITLGLLGISMSAGVSISPLAGGSGLGGWATAGATWDEPDICASFGLSMFVGIAGTIQVNLEQAFEGLKDPWKTISDSLNNLIDGVVRKIKEKKLSSTTVRNLLLKAFFDLLGKFGVTSIGVEVSLGVDVLDIPKVAAMLGALPPISFSVTRCTQKFVQCMDSNGVSNSAACSEKPVVYGDPDGKRCLMGTSCKYCNKKATHWWGNSFTSCGTEPCWAKYAFCGWGTTCKMCCNGDEYWIPGIHKCT